MSLFIDTSALYALLDGDEPRHAEVVESWQTAIGDGRILYTSNYVLVETFALVQRRLGLDATRGLATVFMPLLQPVWVDQELHAAATASLFTAAQRHLSLVDCTSFELMRRLGLTDALALDSDFARQGFNLLPA
ncbi:MAG: PIN domain-containing protein [Gammaproteobacteria bacterium]|nr:PIN domain-containing protein [Gammaproteobacteria bacterium]